MERQRFWGQPFPWQVQAVNHLLGTNRACRCVQEDAELEGVGWVLTGGSAGAGLV